MSTSIKRPLTQAIADAEAFRDLFPTVCYRSWTIAGSVRRKCPQVSDVEHVVVPAFGDLRIGDGLFAETVNLLWHHLDALVQAGALTKHFYGATGPRWGPKYRGIDFRGFNHEIFCADADNHGSILAIRTGPPEFSQRLVTRMRRNLFRNIDGYVWRCEPCPQCDGRGGGADGCTCDGTGLSPAEKRSVGDECEYLRICGSEWIEPQDRR